MIEKLDLEKVDNPGEATLKAFSILNQLVDAVNKLETMAKNINTVLESLVEENNIHEKQIDELQMKVEPEKCKIPTDPYAEQRKWEGKLCWFWDEDPEDKIVDVLSCIDISDKYPYVMCDHQVHYKYCEPVKPDDSIIYKG